MHVRTTTSMLSTKRTTGRFAALLVGVVALCLLLLPAAVSAKAKPVAAQRPATQVKRLARVSWLPHINRSIVSTGINQLGSQVATWYGPGFWGHGTACGSTLTPKSWGIAHRTLPCGTLVTISNGKRTLTVPVIDRGPFSGATIDLTQRTRDYLGFKSGSVGMQQVTKYRLVPLPKPVSGIVALR